jgi:hypothetical protein
MKVSFEIPIRKPIECSEKYFSGILDIINKPEYEGLRDSIGLTVVASTK